MYYFALYLGILEHTPQISCQLYSLMCFGIHFPSIGTEASSNSILNCNLVRFGVYMVKLCHEKMLILRCILLPKKLNHLQKKI